MIRYGVVELGKVLGVWILAALVLTASAGLVLWLLTLVMAHGLVLVYRCRGYRARVVRDGIEIRVRRVPKPSLVLRPLSNKEFAEFQARWLAAHAAPSRLHAVAPLRLLNEVGQQAPLTAYLNEPAARRAEISHRNPWAPADSAAYNSRPTPFLRQTGQDDGPTGSSGTGSR
ncbi:hypothetical protein [Umezawaea tangerina]|uniref:Uncharacterized protein n=1 Tax=Umezawaea tangerina TaxID=84725 RepID=A0A2T0SPL3_9PSEU|nr:hypothetical protein [Umezawaea tangerina]PRY35361.1 hypothetical protein CLV43_114279 [Umezawaea tangerina]